VSVLLVSPSEFFPSVCLAEPLRGALHPASRAASVKRYTSMMEDSLTAPAGSDIAYGAALDDPNAPSPFQSETLGASMYAVAAPVVSAKPLSEMEKHVDLQPWAEGKWRSTLHSRQAQHQRGHLACLAANERMADL